MVIVGIMYFIFQPNEYNKQPILAEPTYLRKACRM